MREFNKIPLLTDCKYNLGGEIIKAAGGNYDFSEYRMKLDKRIFSESMNIVNLRKAEKFDRIEVRTQNKIHFGNENENINEEEINIDNSYIIELNGGIIGKINIEYNDNSAFICEFGILPEFRGKGYGKAALIEALNLIDDKNINEVVLDVECKNDRALNLYKHCGFKEVSILNYYKYSNR